MKNEIKSFDELLEKLKPLENVVVKELKTKYKIKITNKISSGFIEFAILKKNKEKCLFDYILATAKRGKLYFSPRNN